MKAKYKSRLFSGEYTPADARRNRHVYREAKIGETLLVMYIVNGVCEGTLYLPGGPAWIFNQPTVKDVIRRAVAIARE